MLATGCRAVHHVSAGIYEESRNRKTQRGDVPDADLRRADHGDALADTEARRGAFPARAREESGGADSRERSDWDGPCDGTGGDAADSAGPRRNDVCGLFAARSGGNGALPDE